MPSLNHVHIYVRAGARKKNKTFMCSDPHCTHKEKKEYLVGKASRCPNCLAEFVLTNEDLKRRRPLCLACRNTKEAQIFKEKRSTLSEILGDLLEGNNDAESK